MARPERIAPSRNSISVFFPCHNEQDNIRSIYESASKILGQMGGDNEIIFVDDGSADETSRIADAIAADDPRVKVIHHPGKLGYGAALQSGFRTASKSLIFFTDCDGQFDLNELPPLLPLMETFDIVSCFRLNRREGVVRKFRAWCWTRMVCFLFGLRVRDLNCAFKLYKRKVFDNIRMESRSSLINGEILARAKRHGFSITQTGVHHFPRAGGRPGPKTKAIFRAFCDLGKLYWSIRHE